MHEDGSGSLGNKASSVKTVKLQNKLLKLIKSFVIPLTPFRLHEQNLPPKHR